MGVVQWSLDQGGKVSGGFNDLGKQMWRGWGLRELLGCGKFQSVGRVYRRM